MADAKVVLQSALRASALEKMEFQRARIAILQKRLNAKRAAFYMFSAKHCLLNNKVDRVKARDVARATVLDNQKFVAGNFERPDKRAKVTCQCRESSITPSTAVFSALLVE